MEVPNQDHAGSWLEIRFVAGKQSINSELESYQVRTESILDRRNFRRRFMPLLHTSGMEFIYHSAVLVGYPEEFKSGGIAIRIHVVGVLVFGKPRR